MARFTLSLAALSLPVALLACNTRVQPPEPPTPPSEPEAPPIVRAETPPPPIVGGGLLITDDGRLAVVADLDRDVIWVIDLEAGTERGRITLAPGDRPNRLAADGEGRVHVALRRGGALVSIDPYVPERVRRTDVCPAPRGVAYDPADDTVYVACLDGALLGLDPVSHAERRRVEVAPDLRDVVVDGDRILVSTFRAAQVFAVAADDTVEPVAAAVEAHLMAFDGRRRFEPRVAWRMVPGPEGARLLHQRHRAETLPLLDRPVAYYDAGVGVVHATVAPVERPSGASPEARLITTLPVDLAVAPDGMIAVADPPGAFQDIASGEFGPGSAAHIVFGAGAVAVAWRGRDLVGFMREPAALWVVRPSLGHGPATTLATITLSTGSVADTGHALFHEAAAAGITCASCHPEGGEDGHVWRFEAFGPRRTQSLRGGLSQRAPFHWSGDLADVAALMAEVFVRRMGGRGFGESPSEAEIAALTDWLDTVPHLPTAALDPEAAARGRRVFEAIGCDECHFADGTVDPDSHDVGTGEPLQVPSLIGVGHRLPLMHDGCAATLADRFDPACGGGDAHGLTSTLSEAEQADLTSWLRAL